MRALSQNTANQFITSLIKNDDITYFIDKSEITLSNRLGIKYQGVKNKFLISYDIDESIKKKIRKEELSYQIEIKKLSGNYSKIIFTIPEIDYQKDFFFKSEKYISPLYFYTTDWSRITSKHFIFVINDNTIFNEYCVENMERFFPKAAKVLNLSKKQLKKIEKQKILYYLCKDQEEIKKITGYKARGIFSVAYDAVTTTFNAHYHELMHLLINYKIGNLPLYTQPFLQEGFAVAIGGRGGKEPKIIHNLGHFLYKSEFINYTDLLSRDHFYQLDASLSYPASGLYNYFLIGKIGIDAYIKLYLKYSGNKDDVDNMKIDTADLPPISSWNAFLNNYQTFLNFINPSQKANLIYQESSNRIYQDDNRYYFMIKDTLLIKNSAFKKKYKSKKFEEIFKHKKYNGEKYLIVASANEISIYNLFTNNLIESYVSSFSSDNQSVLLKDGFYIFSVKKTFMLE